MFTGIIERTGKIVSVSSQPAGISESIGSITQYIVDPGKNFDTSLGDSVAVNGCCLTVTANKMQLLCFDVSKETLDKTTLDSLKEGQDVNLERAMALGARLGGHLVSGHVDCRGSINEIKKNADGWIVKISIPSSHARYLIPKGSVCVDGVSLTVNSLQDFTDQCEISLTLIPTTISLTRFRSVEAGDSVNIEVDMIGKYIERINSFR